MKTNWTRRLSLVQRVAIAASVSVAAVALGYSVLLRSTVKAEVNKWELERLGAVAHHVANMVARDEGSDHKSVIARVAEDHRNFGYDVSWIESGQPGPGKSAVTVALTGVPGFVRVSAVTPVFETLVRRLWIGCALLAGGAVLAVFLAIQGSVHWGLVRPLKSVRYQLRLMRRGPWVAPAAAFGSREIIELATELEAVGHSLDRRITTWIHAERRAAFEETKLNLRNDLTPPARELNLVAGDLLARGTLDPSGITHLRRLLLAIDTIMDTVRPVDDAEGSSDTADEEDRRTGFDSVTSH